jgi:lysozyme family protein
MPFHNAITKLLDIEGGFSNHANDRGGQTRWGITEQTARRNGYTGAMQDLPRSTAEGIYRAEYWDSINLDEVDAISQAMAWEVFEAGVNAGPARAATWLQRALNLFNKRGSLYPDIATDGSIGPKTIKTLRAFTDYRGADGLRVLLVAFNCFQAGHYIEITENNASQEDFIFGWFGHRIGI